MPRWHYWRMRDVRTKCGILFAIICKTGDILFQSLVISTRTCRLWTSPFRVFLKVDSLQVYAIGFIREFAKCKTVPTQTTSAGMHSLQKTSRMTYKNIAGTQQANDNAMIRNTVFESFTFLSMLRLWSLLKGNLHFNKKITLNHRK